MDDMIYMIDKLHLAGIMPVVITDGQFQILSCRENLFHIGRFFEDNADLWDVLCQKAAKQDYPVLYLEENRFAYSVVHNPSRQLYCFLGPMLLGGIRKGDIWSYRNMTTYSVSSFSLDLSFSVFEDYVCALYLAAFHEQIDEERLIAENSLHPTDCAMEKEDFLRLQIQSSEEKKGPSYLPAGTAALGKI